MNDDFLGGVIEGFYGQPWTQAQRLKLIPQLAEWGLNTYFYAPKDDLKHRALWRQSYEGDEAAIMRELVAACHQHGLHFIYGLSPGLDIQFSDPAELVHVVSRLSQMIDFGARGFALLFDDLPGEINHQDAAKFPSVAAAQISVVNAVFERLIAPFQDRRLLFCPTPYCDRMVRRGVGGGLAYLDTIGRELNPQIDVFWTGPAIISPQIPVVSIQALRQRIGRQPVIWDNLHANDYDQRRLYCGPYNRAPELRDAVRGILSNPNNEFPINYIPLRTLGEYLRQPQYEPRRAYLTAAADWAQQFQTIKSQISAADIVLLADCHYLPFSDGAEAVKIDQLATTLISQPVAEWGDALELFEEYHQRVTGLFEQLSQLRDRELFYAWSRRIWDLREELDLISDFAQAKRDGRLIDNGFASETHLPMTCRGGFVANLQRRLRMDEHDRFVATHQECR